MMTTDEMIKYDMIVDMGIATPEELNLVKNIAGGTWNHIFDMVVDVRTEWHTFDQLLTEEEEN